MFRVVAEGRWLYDETVEKPVFVIETDYDAWYAIGAADGDLDSDDTPVLNSDGRVYYLRFSRPDLSAPFWPESGGFLSIEDAKASAAARLPSAVAWH